MRLKMMMGFLSLFLPWFLWTPLQHQVAYCFDLNSVCVVSATLPPCVALGYCSGPQVAVVVLVHGQRPGVSTERTGQHWGAAAAIPVPLDTWGTAIGVRH